MGGWGKWCIIIRREEALIVRRSSNMYVANKVSSYYSTLPFVNHPTTRRDVEQWYIRQMTSLTSPRMDRASLQRAVICSAAVYSYMPTRGGDHHHPVHPASYYLAGLFAWRTPVQRGPQCWVIRRSPPGTVPSSCTLYAVHQCRVISSSSSFFFCHDLP